MHYVQRKIGLRHTDITFFVTTPYYYVAKDLRAGAYSFLGPRAYICPNVTIGNYTMIASDVLIVGGDHNYNIPGLPIIFHDRPAAPSTIIGDDAWIGARVTIMAGVHIERGSIIGAGSIVTRNIPAYTIAGGVPAKTLKKRFTNPEDVAKHDKMLSQRPKAYGNFTMPKKLSI